MFWKNNKDCFCCLKSRKMIFFLLQPNHCLVSIAMQHMRYVVIPVLLLLHFCVVVFSWMISPGGTVSRNCFMLKNFFLSTYG